MAIGADFELSSRDVANALQGQPVLTQQTRCLQGTPVLSPWLRYRTPTRRAPAKYNKMLVMFCNYSPHGFALAVEITVVSSPGLHVWVHGHGVHALEGRLRKVSFLDG